MLVASELKDFLVSLLNFTHFFVHCIGILSIQNLVSNEMIDLYLYSIKVLTIDTSWLKKQCMTNQNNNLIYSCWLKQRKLFKLHFICFDSSRFCSNSQISQFNKICLIQKYLFSFPISNHFCLYSNFYVYIV